MTEQNSTFDYDRYYGKTVIDTAGDKVGEVGQVYLDDATGRPEWVTVRTGLFGTKETFVPLQSESFEGDQLRVPYTKEQIKGAPSIDPDGHITEAEEDELYRYYSLGTDRRVADAGYVGTDRTAADRTDTQVAADRTVGRDDNLADGEVVRHEERLNVGTERVETGRVRIRKHVVTEQQTVTVPVTREEIRVERVPLADGEVTDETLTEGETEVVLHEERPVVTKETVGVEKVRVGTDEVTENRTVSADVAKEQVEVVEDGVDHVNGTQEHRSLLDKAKDKLDRDHDGHIG